MTDYPRCARPGQTSYSFDDVDRNFRAVFGEIPKPIDPMAVDVTPETLADRETVAAVRAHIETWKASKGTAR